VRFAVLVVGKGGAAWADEAVADWTKRIARHGRIDEEAVKPEPFRGDVDAVRKAESDRVAARLTDRDRLVVLDERGADFDTPAFAALVKGCRDGGVHRLVLALGGPYGHDVSLRDRAWKVVRLSSLVLNHEVARVVLYEQIYRACDLLAGGPYHH
jgi:23S rRNA (pseudouridine1915-N3)-methyltransferase